MLSSCWVRPKIGWQTDLSKRCVRTADVHGCRCANQAGQSRAWACGTSPGCKNIDRTEKLNVRRSDPTVRPGLGFESRPGIIGDLWCFCATIFAPMIRDHARFAVGAVALAIMIAPEAETRITLCT